MSNLWGVVGLELVRSEVSVRLLWSCVEIESEGVAVATGSAALYN